MSDGEIDLTNPYPYAVNGPMAPISQEGGGGMSDELEYEDFLNMFCYVETLDYFYFLNVSAGEKSARLTPAAFRRSYGRYSITNDKNEQISYPKCWHKDKNAIIRRSIEFEPGKPVLIPGAFNIWREPPCTGLVGDKRSIAARMFEELIRHLSCGRDEVYEVLCLWLAHAVHSPDKLIPWALFLISNTRGMGKGMLCETMKSIFGRSMSCTAETLANITGQFTSHRAGKMLVTVAEAVNEQGFRAASMDEIKALISERDVKNEPKGKDAEMIQNFARYIFCSNKLDALKIDANERRFYVVNMKEAPAKSDEFYADYVGAVLPEGSNARLQAAADIVEFLRQWAAKPCPQRAPGSDLQDVVDEFRPGWIDDLNEEFRSRRVAVKTSIIIKFAREKSQNPHLNERAVTKVLTEYGWHKGRRRLKAKIEDEGEDTASKKASKLERYWSNSKDHETISFLTEPTPEY